MPTEDTGAAPNEESRRASSVAAATPEGRGALSELQRLTAGAGAVLLLIGYLTGGLLAMAMTGKVNASVHDVVAAHLNGVLGCFWLCALAFTLPFLKLEPANVRWLVIATIVPSYANWFITTVKAFFHVAGVGLEGNGANDAVFVALNSFVVLPSLASTIVWAYALLRKHDQVGG